MILNCHYYVYMMASKSQTIYIGATNNLERRISEHKQELTDGFTKKYQCKKLVYYEDFSDINQAISREKYFKGKNRKFKIDTINKLNPEWQDLSLEWS